MAYMNFTEVAGGHADAVHPVAQRAAHDDASRFSALEWSVVAIARADSLSSLNAPGRVSVALGALFGERQNPRLADARLEALRRMAVLSWHHGYSVPAPEIAAFHAAGFTAHHYETLLASISRGRAARSRKN
ncbi:hypothetical protein D1610_02870 [Sphingomonas gilva]|uniref:Uncharacterized protein n=1 Tax=Sphingomonas gilva TaxID=2305907 RepID=A0A396RRP7_9SPHN|nr:hypothetical protein [Sphingomonas gilva]RHW19079.1 hypothetical protein D1610_02870 [Sphingomonas gilva]